jgi:dsDNA-specific endonuclease/ATPase MutS2
MKDWYSEIVALFVGLSPTIFNAIRDKRHDEKSDFEVLTQKYKEIYEEIKESNEECERKYRELFDEMLRLKLEINKLKI